MTMTTDEREQILTEIEQTWADLISVLRGFDEEELRIPNVIGIWSLKDLLAHLATWDQIAVSKIELAEAGDDRPWWKAANAESRDIDEFNEADAESRAHLSFDELWTQLHSSHEEMLRRVRETPALTRELIREDTYDHYRDHLNDIRNWQASR